MAHYLDIAAWSRRATYLHFLDYEHPTFGVTTSVDITRLLAFAREQQLRPLSLVYQYCSVRAANDVPEFRMRRRGREVLVHEVVQLGTIIPIDDSDALDFLNVPYRETLGEFLELGRGLIERVQAATVRMSDEGSDDAVIYHSVLPWFTFTSMSNARRAERDSIPRIVLGRHYQENRRTRMPVSIEVDHAMMDALHVARYLERFQHHCDTVTL